MSIGASRRPELVIVHPSAVRATSIVSWPTGEARTKIVKLDGVGWLAAGHATAQTKAANVARIEWDQGIVFNFKFL